MEGLFVFPGLVEIGKGVGEALFSQEGRSSPESGNPNIDFDQLLEESVKRTEEGFWGTPFASLRSCQSCGSENPSQAPNPCSFASLSTPQRASVTTLGCPSSESPSPSVDLSGVRESIAQFLEDLEGINFTLDLGEKGIVKVEGMKNENGEFSFQIQGSKDALTELFTMLFGYLTTMVQGEAGTQSCSQDCSFSCGKTSASCSGGEEEAMSLSNVVSFGNSPVENVLTSETENGEDAELLSAAEDVGTDEGSIPDGEIDVDVDQGIVPEGNVDADEGMVVEMGENVPEEAMVEKPREIEDDALETSSIGNGERSSRAKTETRSSDRMENLTSLSNPVTASTAEVVSSRGEVVSISNLSDSNEVEKIFDSILRFASRGEGNKEVVVKLQPESLGSIVVHLREDANRLQCVWEIADVKTRELIQKSLPLLEARLQGQGFTFENFWGGSYQGQPDWRNTSGWVLSSFPDVVGGSEELDNPAFGDYRVNLLA